MLEIGCIVKLKSGGPSMTVLKKLNDNWIEAVWFINGAVFRAEFHIGVLTIQ
jgi:uncharacterized protein YodC (DUF2158 family)